MNRKSLLLLKDIFAAEPKKERFLGFRAFLICKSSDLHLPLTPEERMLNDTIWFFRFICTDGWPFPFEESYSFQQLSDVTDVLRFCGLTSYAEAILEARELFYNGRTDLLSVHHRREAGIRGFRRPPERRRFHEIGEFVVGLPLLPDYHELVRWPEAHRSEFIDFPRH
jgi:hypothetical protein